VRSASDHDRTNPVIVTTNTLESLRHPPRLDGTPRTTRKDPSLVDLETAEPATESAGLDFGRRNLFARAGLAGFTGLAAALVIDRTALATTDERPNVPTEADRVVLAQVIGLELAASELYRVAAGGASDELAPAVLVMAENHQAYAQAIAGKTGLSAQDMDAEVYSAFESRFTGSEQDFLGAAHELEQSAVSTHTAVIGDYESAEAIALTASILVVEARHATVLADLLGVDDFDVLFENDQPALSLAGDA
jgi:Ferritin-like domain